MSMTLRVLLPHRMLAEVPGVEFIDAQTTGGSLGLLPRRLDCVAILVPGILSYRIGAIDRYIAVDTGILVKTAMEVCASVRNAIEGTSLAQLQSEVDVHFLKLDEEERQARTALAKIEVGFLRRVGDLRP